MNRFSIENLGLPFRAMISCRISPPLPCWLISNHVRSVSLAWPSTFWVPCPHNCSLPPLPNIDQRCWKTGARKPYDSLLYAPGAIVARASNPAGSRRTAPFLPHQACPISHSFSSRLVPAVESAFWSACRSKIKTKTKARPDQTENATSSASPTMSVDLTLPHVVTGGS